MAFKHGIYINERPTSLVPMKTAESAITIAFVVAPVNTIDETYKSTNVPKVCFNLKEFVESFGYSNDNENWYKYTSNEVCDTFFKEYNTAPLIVVNVLDPNKHIKNNSEKYILDIQNSKILSNKDILLDTINLEVEVSEEKPVDNKPPTGENSKPNSRKNSINLKNTKVSLVNNKDFKAEFDENKNIKITLLDKKYDKKEVQLTYSVIDPDSVTVEDFIGGFNKDTNSNTGLELIDEIFQRFQLIPTIAIAPKFSSNPKLANAMAKKMSNINNLFKGIALVDLPVIDNNNIINYSEIVNWKNKNITSSNNTICCYPRLKNGDRIYDFSAHLAPLLGIVDCENNSIPFVSPSNHNLEIQATILKDEEIYLTNEQANYLNSNGILTALNFIGGWKCWGNRTSIYPSVTDTKDVMIPVRRMMDWVSNTIVTSFWQKIDTPMTKRGIYYVVNSLNMWLDSLAAQGVILDGKVEFKVSENPTIDLIDGILKFDVYITPPTPMETIIFSLEYDTDSLNKLFG